MLFFLTSRIISSLVAFLYPGYASYKTLSQRPASEEDLERWLMYWSVLGCVVGVEYVAEWTISWIPFYNTLKTLFLLYLALPQTRGSSYLYTHHLQPFLRSHEAQIDTALAKLKAKVYAFVQQRARMVWDQAAVAMGQPQRAEVEEEEEEEEETRGGSSSVAAGPAQLVSNLWASYGPGILAGGMALMRQGAASSSSSGFKRATTTPPPPAAATDEGVARQTPDSAAVRRNVGHRRDRSGSGGSSGKFEEVEAPSDVEGW